MGNWRGRYLHTGPPRGPGHYAEGGRWWWDDDRRRWFRTTSQEDVLEVEAEDVGGISLAASLLTTLSSQYGNGYFRFVARARSTDRRRPTYAMAGATFPGTRPAAAPTGGPRSIGGRTSTGRRRPTPMNRRRGAHDAGAGDGGDQVRRHR